uniref:inositol-polyphosphate 5-phosphatase n=1 Tax=Dermatophagoides pteronyssinus TaxID=6956 RepID=A0A6P6YDU8_DERPT|nr:type I inositol 1,4,5-trisphosphate 5-phosphatase-like [Dermatophagoides pteronyssinus]
MMTEFLFITANVGSIFQDSKLLLESWIAEFVKTVDRLKPKFIALHCQEFGGKDFRKTSTNVDDFVRTLISSNEMIDFEIIRIFLDENYSFDDKYTALGSFYFIHKTQHAFIWNFDVNEFVSATGREIHSGCIENVPVKFKRKFPECKWSRKGFMKTRWMINEFIFDTINVHLFHDESNFVSISDFPSIYAKNRRKAFEYLLDSIGPKDFNDLPIFIFGDFNFRLDTKAVVQRLTINSRLSQKKTKNGDLSRLLYRNDVNDDRLLSIEKKQFIYSDQNFFTDPNNLDWLMKQDKELNHFQEKLWEFDRHFLPSYPFEEDIDKIASSSSTMLANSYMKTRCPAWCDRVIMNNTAKQLLTKNENQRTKIQYDMMGKNSPMGDHKPIYLYFECCTKPTTDKNSTICSVYDDHIHRNREKRETNTSYLVPKAINLDINNNDDDSSKMMYKTTCNSSLIAKRSVSATDATRKTTSTTTTTTTIKKFFYYHYVVDAKKQQRKDYSATVKSTLNSNVRVIVMKETVI